MELNESGSTLRNALPLLLAATCSTEAGALSLDHWAKASYLWNLLRFIEWPRDAGGRKGRLNMRICGADSLDAFYALHDGRVGNRAISVERIKDITGRRINDCQLLVIGADAPVLSVPIARGLLTVGESEGFTARGGIINLLLIGGRIRFEINEEMARACGFVIDPRLLKLRMPWYLAQVA